MCQYCTMCTNSTGAGPSYMKSFLNVYMNSTLTWAKINHFCINLQFTCVEFTTAINKTINLRNYVFFKKLNFPLFVTILIKFKDAMLSKVNQLTEIKVLTMPTYTLGHNQSNTKCGVGCWLLLPGGRCEMGCCWVEYKVSGEKIFKLLSPRVFIFNKNIYFNVSKIKFYMLWYKTNR
jgi:hypothetical protein